MEQKKISTELKYKGNPRQITGKQFDLLKSHIEELGDLSGVIYCQNNKAYLGGNQRSEVFNGAEIQITERFIKPTKNKTVALGYILHNGEKYAYREVKFSKEEFQKACIVANNDGGSFDWDIINSEWSDLPLEDWGLDVPGFGKEIEGNFDDEGIAAKNQYGVMVICGNEGEQEKAFKELTNLGFSCKVVVT